MADGTIDTASGKPFATAKGGPDGLCLDCAGNLYASTSAGVEVFSPAGVALGMVPTGRATNCTFGRRFLKDHVRGSGVVAQGGADDHSRPARLITKPRAPAAAWDWMRVG